MAHLVVVGFSNNVINKYLVCFKEAIKIGKIDSYSIVEMESQKNKIDKRIKSIELKPEYVFYIPDPKTKNIWADPRDFQPIFDKLLDEKGKIRVYIATEAKAHEGYLTYCVENGIESLVEKPIIAPMEGDQFNSLAIEPFMRYITQKAEEMNTNHSVMTLSRYHKIYNEEVLDPIKKIMLELEAPLTSFHIRVAEGVWNLHKEYESREDHPYKYGYGMLLHGAYHYVDLMAQFLNLNKLIFPTKTFTLTISSFTAHPSDQNDRIPKKFSEKFDDNKPNWHSLAQSIRYGETDITSIFCMKDKETEKNITLGTISLEQTTQSIRSWKDAPHDLYNKNGRISNVNLDADLSTLYSINVRCFDSPTHINQDVDKIGISARIHEKTNAALLNNKEYSSVKNFADLSRNDSNRQLMLKWLKNEEYKSLLKNHVLTMRIIQAIAMTIKQPGYPVTFDFI